MHTFCTITHIQRAFTDLYGDDSTEELKSADNGSYNAICLLVLYVGHPNTERNSAYETETFSNNIG